MLNTGLPNLQGLIPMVDDPENGNAIVAYASLVAVYSMGLPAVQQHHSGAPQSPLDALLHIFDLARGTAHIYEKAYHVVREGPLKPITQVDVFKNADPTSLHLAPTFQRRTTLEKIDELGRWLDEANEPQERVAHCKVAHERLVRVAYNTLMPNEQVVGHEVLPWVAVLDGEYINALRERYPPALTILIYFCLLLRDDCWYTKGWRAWILDSTDALTLPVPWGDLVLWAQHQVRTDKEFLDIRNV